MNEILFLLKSAPPGLIEAVIAFIRAAMRHEDPERAAKAAAAKLATDAALREVLR